MIKFPIGSDANNESFSLLIRFAIEDCVLVQSCPGTIRDLQVRPSGGEIKLEKKRMIMMKKTSVRLGEASQSKNCNSIFWVTHSL
jgi:hypothetical protein